jgi:phage tail sheath protein FI
MTPPVLTATGSAPRRTPGIYREQVLPEPRAAELPTGVCALLGVAARGPFYRPVALRRSDEFAGVFGAAPAGSHLAAAVEGFFAAGGSSCYVIRVDPADGDWPARGLAALVPLEDADLVAVPDLGAAPATRWRDVQRAVLEHCESSGTRFAVLDAFPGATAADALAQRAELRSRSGALYFPWVRLTGGQVVPPSGHVAGMYAAVDAARGVGAAPANLELPGVLDLVPPPTPAEVDELSAAGVNPLRALPGRGIRVWGARSLAGPGQAEWTSVGVCRLFLSLARWLRTTGEGFVFEPDDVQTWVRVRRELSERLWRLWRQGTLAGATPEAAFYVKCDAETNPRVVRDAGLVVTEIGLAPSVPAEFVVVRLVQQDGRTTFA